MPATVVDPTGAGDAFTAGFVAARWRGAPVDDACLHAMALAARAVSVHGAWAPPY